jgi:hypothetical protein
MKIQPLCATLFVILFMSGCTSIGTTKYAIDLQENKESKGIYPSSTVYGTSVSLNALWKITASHNASLFDPAGFYPHPLCDIALVRTEGTLVQDYFDIYISTLVAESPLIHQGYVDRETAITHTKGTFIDRTIINNCPMGSSTAPLYFGMSGGGVYNEAGQLVGINSGYAPQENTTITTISHFTLLCDHKKWIADITGIHSFCF